MYHQQRQQQADWDSWSIPLAQHPQHAEGVHEVAGNGVEGQGGGNEIMKEVEVSLRAVNIGFAGSYNHSADGPAGEGGSPGYSTSTEIPHGPENLGGVEETGSPKRDSSASAITHNVATTVAPSVSARPKKPISWASVVENLAKGAPAIPTPSTAACTNKPAAIDRNPGTCWANNNSAGRNSNVVKVRGERLMSPARTGRNIDSVRKGMGMSRRTNCGDIHPVLEQLKAKNRYNPRTFDLTANGARFFIIKSYSEDDIHRSIKHNIWCSTRLGNKRLDQAYSELNGKGAVYLFFSANGSGHFCGMAQMKSAVDYSSYSGVWVQERWKGQFCVRWLYIKDVPNGKFRHILLQNNENRPVTQSRDTQEVPHEQARKVLEILHSYKHETSILDDFYYYEKTHEEGDERREMRGGR